MLKFQRIRTKPELIRIFLNSSLWATKEATVAHSNQKTRTNIKRHFGQKCLELLPENWKLNGNIFFKLCFSYLDAKMTSAGYKRERNKNIARRGVRHVQVVKAYLWIISALEAINFPQVTFLMFTNVLAPISERFELKFWANKHRKLKNWRRRRKRRRLAIIWFKFYSRISWVTRPVQSANLSKNLLKLNM